MTTVTGLILAGGAGRRMGADKARLVVDGRPLLASAVDRVRELTPHILLASGDGRRLADAGVPQIADPVPDAGPLGAIAAGLAAAETDVVAVVAVDQPDADADVLRFLVSLWDGQLAVVAEVGGRLQPLHAVWSTEAAEEVRAAFDAGERSPTRLLGRSRVLVVTETELAAAGVGIGFVRDLDTPEDLADRGGM